MTPRPGLLLFNYQSGFIARVRKVNDRLGCMVLNLHDEEDRPYMEKLNTTHWVHLSKPYSNSEFN